LASEQTRCAGASSALASITLSDPVPNAMGRLNAHAASVFACACRDLARALQLQMQLGAHHQLQSDQGQVQEQFYRKRVSQLQAILQWQCKEVNKQTGRLLLRRAL
jgi:hypothetical protein